MSLQELYAQAARCAVESIGLDGAIMLRRRDDRWEIAASHLPHPELGIHCNLCVLDELLRTPETLFHGNPAPARPITNPQSAIRNPQLNYIPSQPVVDSTKSATIAPAVVVSPLRTAAGELLGAIYGFRSVRAGNTRRTIRYLEAQMIELLAGAVSEGIARIEQEAEVDRRRALLERAFSLATNHEARRIITEKREVTLLFADLRQSTNLSALFEIDEMCELMGQVLDCLAVAVMGHDGIVIDYYGDGLAAMWNAPADQADHAELACRAALRMLETLPDVAADWADVLDADLRLAIGIHTGIVQVGNAGSTRRTKYGPRGQNVHVVSRVEAAAKEFNVPLVVTQHTVERLSNRFTTHRICRARIRGVYQPIQLFQVSAAKSEPVEDATWKSYGEALLLFENGQLAEAAEMLRTILPTHSKTVPAQFLAEHIQHELNRQLRRRSTDTSDGRQAGIITLGAK
jgi:adenylate cyclase